MEQSRSVNLTGAWLCSQAVARHMVKRRRGGRIINVSSVHEELAMPSNAPYCASKGGIRMLMRTIALELAEHGITVNDVCPGAVDTPMDARLRAIAKLRRLLAEIPLRRMAGPEEIAELCVFLASSAGAYITGASYTIDGGMSKQSGSLVMVRKIGSFNRRGGQSRCRIRRFLIPRWLQAARLAAQSAFVSLKRPARLKKSTRATAVKPYLDRSSRITGTEHTGIALTPLPGSFVIHPAHQEHRFSLSNGVGVRENIFVLSGKPSGRRGRPARSLLPGRTA